MSVMRPVTPPPSLVHAVAGELLRRVITNRGEPVTRTTYLAELTRVLPMSHPTVTRAARELIDQGLVIDGAEVPRGVRGRPEKALEPDRSHVLIGVSVSDVRDYARTSESGRHHRASRVHAVAVRLDGEALQPAEEQVVDSAGIDALVEAIINAVVQLKPVAEPEGAPLGIGVMIGGHVADGVLRWSHNVGVLDHNTSVDLADRLRGELRRRGLPGLGGIPILVENDADALARFQAWFGKPGYASVDRFAALLLKDDGLGGALVINGETAVVGPFEVGHLESQHGDEGRRCRCGNRGCVETVATPLAMAESLGIDISSVARWTSELVRRLADPSDSSARSVADRAGQALGRAVATVATLTGPQEVFVLAPEYLVNDHAYVAIVKEEAQRRTFPSLRGDLTIQFLPLPELDEMATAAAAQVIEHVVDSFERKSG